MVPQRRVCNDPKVDGAKNADHNQHKGGPETLLPERLEERKLQAFKPSPTPPYLSILVMTPLNLEIQCHLMKVPHPSRLLQHPNLLFLQLPPNNLLQLFLANLRARRFFLGDLVPRLEARLHPDPERRVVGYRLGVGTDVGCSGGLGVGDAEESVARGLQGERGGVVGDGD
jgi:hypothetical protein